MWVQGLMHAGPPHPLLPSLGLTEAGHGARGRPRGSGGKRLRCEESASALPGAKAQGPGSPWPLPTRRARPVCTGLCPNFCSCPGQAGRASSKTHGFVHRHLWCPESTRRTFPSLAFEKTVYLLREVSVCIRVPFLSSRTGLGRSPVLSRTEDPTRRQ